MGHVPSGLIPREIPCGSQQAEFLLGVLLGGNQCAIRLLLGSPLLLR